jgi:hypothetical protein
MDPGFRGFHAEKDFLLLDSLLSPKVVDSAKPCQSAPLKRMWDFAFSPASLLVKKVASALGVFRTKLQVSKKIEPLKISFDLSPAFDCKAHGDLVTDASPVSLCENVALMNSVAADGNNSVEFVSQPDLLAVSPQLAGRKVVKPRKKKQCTPLVDTSVRRCTRSMAKLDGFRAPIAQDGQARKKYKKTGKAAAQKKVTA